MMLITLQITVNLLFLKSTKHNEQACHVAINNGSVQLRNQARVFFRSMEIHVEDL